MPNPKLETYKNKATNTVYDLTDANAQASLTAILDGTSIDSFADVESALSGKFPREEQRVLGAVNMAKPSSVTSKTSSGVVYTNTKGVVVANNEATADAYMGWDIGHLPQGTYKLVGCPADGSASKYCVRLGIGDTASEWGTFVAADYGNGEIFTVTDENKFYSIACRVFSGYTANNVIFKPMVSLDLNVSYADYVPYAMTNKELTEKVTQTSESFGQVTASKNGDVVSLAFTGTTIVNEDGKTLGTLSSDYRPKANNINIYTKVYNGSSYVDAQVKVSASSGAVELLTLSGNAVAGAMLNFLLCRPIFLR